MNDKTHSITSTTPATTTTARRPDCVTEVRMGNSVLTVSGYFKRDATDTAADKMMRVLEAESAIQRPHSA